MGRYEARREGDARAGEPQASVGRIPIYPGDAEPGDLDRGAAVHDDLKPGGFGAGGGSLVDDAELQPDRFRADGNRLVDGLARGGGIAEDVDDVDLVAELGVRGRRIPRGCARR